MTASRASTTRLLGFLLVVNVGVRLVLHAIYQPVVFPDSISYVGYAYKMLHLDFSGFIAMRTPGYPLLVLLTALDPRLLWVAQSILGVLVSVLMFRIGSDLTGDDRVGLALGLAGGLTPNLLYFEAVIMTEVLTTFLVVLIAFMFLRLVSAPAIRTRDHLLFGAVLGYAVITRPSMLFVIPVYAVFLLLPDRSRPTPMRKRLGAVTWMVLPGVAMVLALSGFNKYQVDYFGPSALTGYNLTQHCGDFFEQAPDEDATIRDIYVKHRDELGAHAMAIWAARTELIETTGLTHTELSRELTSISLNLFARHPLLYARSVLRAWVLFWTPEHYWIYSEDTSSGPDEWTFQNLRPVFLASLAYGTLLVGSVLLRVLFLVAVIVLIAVPSTRPDEPGWRALASMIPVVVVSSVFTSMLTHGDNFRYLIPFQPLLLIVVVVVLRKPFGRFLSGRPQ